MRSLATYAPVTEVGQMPDVDVALEHVDHFCQLLTDADEDRQNVMMALDGIASDPEISQEGFKETMQKLWELLLAWFRRLRDLWKQNIDTFGNAIRILEYRINQTQDHMRAGGGKRMTSKAFTFSGGIPRISRMYRPPTDVSVLIGSLRHQGICLTGYYQYQRRNLLPNVNKAVQVLNASGTNGLDPSVSDQLAAITDQCSPVHLGQYLHLVPFGHAMASDPMIGNQRLYIKSPGGDGSLGSHLSVRVRLDHAESSPRPMPTEIAFPYFPLQSGEQLLSLLRKNLEILKGPFGSQVTRERSQLLEKMTRQTNDIGRALDALDDAQPVTRQTNEQALRLMKAYTDWLSDPYEGLAASTLRSMRTTLRLIRANFQIT